MNILYITHKMFYPVNGGDCIRMSQMLGNLMDIATVDVMYIAHHDIKSPVRSYQPMVRDEWYLRVRYIIRVLRAASTLLNGRPLLVNVYWHKAFLRRIKAVASNYDAIVLGGLGVAHYCSYINDLGVDVYLDLTDSPTMNLDNESALASGLMKLWHRINARRMRKLESEWRSVCKATAFISEIDRNYINVEASKSVIVGNKVDMCGEAMLCTHESVDSILFVGNMSYAPNIAAVKRFVENVFPIISEALPDVKFRVVGANPRADIVALARKHKNVVVEGFVNDLASCYMNASVVVAPMFSGSGIQNKILQAMAAGCCVVTTPIGAEGLDVTSGAFSVASDDKDLARKCIELLSDKSLRCHLGQNARKYVAQHFAPEVIRQQMSGFIRR